jgi:hypothetical protein
VTAEVVAGESKNVIEPVCIEAVEFSLINKVQFAVDAPVPDAMFVESLTS